MGLFGGGNKNSTTVNESTTNNLVAGEAGYGGVSIAGEGNTANLTVNTTTTDQGAIDLAKSSNNQSFDFAQEALRMNQQATDAAINAANQSAAQAAQVSAQAINANTQLSLATQDNMAGLAKQSLSFGGTVLDTAFGKSFGFAEQVLGFATSNAAITEKATNNALSFANEFSRSDQANAFDTMTKWLAGAFAVAMLAVMWGKK